MKKRIFAGALALLMIIGLLPVSSMVKKPVATQAAEVEQTTYTLSADTQTLSANAKFNNGVFIVGSTAIGSTNKTIAGTAYKTYNFNKSSTKNLKITIPEGSYAEIGVEWTTSNSDKVAITLDKDERTVDNDNKIITSKFNVNAGEHTLGTKIISGTSEKSVYIIKIEVTVKTNKYTVIVNDGATSDPKSYAEGDILKLSATGKNFLYWVNSNGVKVAETTTKDIPVYYSDTYTAVYGKTGNKVTYYTPYGGELATYYADENFTVPEVPTRYGYKATGWDKDIVSVKEALKSGNVEVRPVYDNDTSLTFSITVDTSAIDSAIPKAENVEVNKEVKASVTSDDFAYWSDENGNVLSYNSTYYFLANRSVTVKAVKKSDSGVEKKGVITYIGYESKTIIFEYTVPDTYTMKFAGVLASTNKANVESATVESATVDNRPAGVYKLGADEAKCSSYKTFRYTLKNNGADTWYTRPVLTYIDDSGVEHTIVGTTVYEMN